MMSLHSVLRAQLGVAVPALSVPREGKAGSEPCLLFFGIVDFLQVRIAPPMQQSPVLMLLLHSSLPCPTASGVPERYRNTRSSEVDGSAR
jgi:hypothetical protein